MGQLNKGVRGNLEIVRHDPCLTGIHVQITTMAIINDAGFAYILVIPVSPSTSWVNFGASSPYLQEIGKF